MIKNNNFQFLISERGERCTWCMEAQKIGRGIAGDRACICAARARARACRERVGTVRRGGDDGFLSASSTEAMQSHEAMLAT